MPYDIERFSQLIGSLYDVPFDSAALPAALGDLARLTGVAKTSVVDSHADGSRSFVGAFGIPEQALDAYNAHYQRLDVLLPAYGTPPVAFNRTSAEAYWPEFTRSEFFND